MKFTNGGQEISAQLSDLYVAGWTGRDTGAVQHHIDELAEIGVAPPSQVPLYYRASTAVLTQDAVIEVLGDDTSGECEPFLLKQDGKIYLGLASDHTDRALEAVSVAASKQICAKPVATALWAFDDLTDRLDTVILRTFIEEGADWVLYQDGTLSAIRPLDELTSGVDFKDGSAMLCGTLGAIGGVRPAAKYRMELEDPQTGAKITLTYEVRPLPIIA